MAMLRSLTARPRFGPQTLWRPLRKALTSGFVVCLSVCHFVLVFFSPFSIATGEERDNLSAFRTFVLFVLV